MEKSKEKIDYLYFLQVVCAFSVVFIHTNHCYWYFDASARYWKTANVIECLLYFAVPVFFMISGITLMDYNEKYTLKDYLLKRINKTFVPFFVWSLIGFAYILIKGQSDKFDLSNISLETVLWGIFNWRFNGVYWFFGPLFSIYLSMPLFAAVEKGKKKKVFYYLVYAYIIFNVLIPFIKLMGWGVSVPISVGTVSGYLIFPLIGYLLHKYPPGKVTRVVLYFLGLTGFGLHCFGTYYLSVKQGFLDQRFKDYPNLPSFFYSIAVFMVLQWLGVKIMKTKLKKLFVFLASYSFPIFLMHWYFHDAAVFYLGVDEKSICYRLLAPFAIVVLCIGITWVLRKIPVIKRIVP